MKVLNRFFKIARRLWLFIPFIALQACKDGFLDAKPDSSLIVPSTLEDCQKLLDNNALMTSSFPLLGHSGSDEFYIDYATWQSTIGISSRNAYIWANDIYEGQNDITEWNNSFETIFACNAVLSILENIPITQQNREIWENIKGTALFYRAYRYFALAEVFAMPYNPENAEITLGLPLRLTPDIDYTIARSSLNDTFVFLIADLYESARLIKNNREEIKLNRPSKAAAYGALARIHLVMKEYELALENAEECLALYDELLDYNSIPVAERYPFEINPEILFNAQMFAYEIVFPFPLANYVFISSDLYSLYAPNDLRKEAFYVQEGDFSIYRKYLYSDNGRRVQLFAGIATDEIYLIKAECLARVGNLEESLKTLDQLLIKRYEKGTYIEQFAKTSEDAIVIILEERRKELAFRGARWSDVRRLNEDGYNITMNRELNGQIYTLEPYSPKFAFPIPPLEITLGGLEQNPR